MYNLEGVKWFTRIVKSLAGKKVCELGSQQIWEHAKPHLDTTHDFARDWMIDEGVEEYISVDLNGEGGSIRADLSTEQMWGSIFEHFDIVTNIGTSEHVIGWPPGSRDSILESQMMCFANMFFLCEEGGLIINQLPNDELWKDHALLHYSPAFPHALARAFESPLIACEKVQLATLNQKASLLMFAIQKSGIAVVPEIGRIAREIVVASDERLKEANSQDHWWPKGKRR